MYRHQVCVENGPMLMFEVISFKCRSLSEDLVGEGTSGVTAHQYLMLGTSASKFVINMVYYGGSLSRIGRV